MGAEEDRLQPIEFDRSFFMAHFSSWLTAYGRNLDLPVDFFETLSLSKIHNSEAERQGTGLQRLNHLVNALVTDPSQFVATQTSNRAYFKGVPGNPNWDRRGSYTHTESHRMLTIPGSTIKEKLIVVGHEMRDMSEQDGESLTYEDYVAAEIDNVLGKPGALSGTVGAEIAMQVNWSMRDTLAKLLNLQLAKYMIAHSITDDNGMETMTSGVQVAFSPTVMIVDGMIFYNNRWLRYRQDRHNYYGGQGSAEALLEQIRTYEGNDPALHVWDNLGQLFNIIFEEVPELSRRR